ncbi:cellulase family glycosylhydrolase [Hufsiella ginkgonis]|uniref:Cellulase family glycosylhydrolase n=1 Tax=Hufsiella ginkgonis TaxID=2695274 RepID=A0A7K1Y1U7_9SPHI|nr:cellulase family glycosylhydrolase [Hufsiella ginkgonis]MXV17087.1 cellulase family glycosylhydrolase [Hufsiella ginkgonis]
MLKKLTILFFLAGITSIQVAAQGFLHADGKRIVNGKGENVLLRGMGLGGWMLQEGYMLRINREGQQYRIRERIEELMGAKQTEEFYNLWLANHTRKTDVDSMKAWGFNSIRLPMHFNLYTLPADKEPVAGKNTWLEKGFAITDSLLSWCKANRMYLILDLHAAPGGQGNDLNISDRDPSKPSLWESEANQQKMIALWRKLAERYVNEPWIGAYDIINEPNWGFEDLANDKNGIKEKKNVPLRKLMVDITKAIREVDKNHLVVIEGNGWGNNYNGILPAWDNNMALSFHKYWSYNDPGSVNHMLKMRDEYNIPVWLGETGENSNVWFTEAIRLFETNNIGWAWWPLKKLGFNNPMEIRSNLNYDAVVNYFNGRPGAGKPKESNAYSGLMELATYTRLENTTIHRDVLDAMFRQPFSADAKPFKANKIMPGAVVKAVDFDLGRNGVAYFDKDTADYHVSTGKNTPGNRGRVYRNDGVDIRKDSTLYEQYFVNGIEAGEWLQYTVNVIKKGKYNLRLRVCADNANGKLSVSSGKVTFAKEVAVPNTGNEKNFTFVEIKNVALKAGKQVIRIYADSGGFGFSEIRFTN